MPCPTEPIRRIPARCRRLHAPRPAALLAAVLSATLIGGCVQAPTAPASTASTTPAPADEPAPQPAPAPVPEPPPPPPAPPAADAVLADLIAFHERTRGLAVADVAREQARLAATVGPEATLKLAWMLGQGRAPGDLTRALALLDPLARNGGGPAPFVVIARVLQARLAEQRRLEEQLDRQAPQLRDLQRRNDQLREQLDALRDIERTLGPKPAASAPRSP